MLLLLVPSLSSQLKVLYNPQAFFTHAALLDQACAHCPIFPTAASRRSLGRVSVPVWLIVLSDQLRIDALVGLYPTNKLIRRRFLHRRLSPLTLRCHAVLAAVSRCCSPLEGRLPTRYSPVCRSTRGVAPPFALDLHVLGTPPALILSQDQTLQLNCFSTRDLLVLKALPLRKRFALSSFQGAVPRLGTRPEYRSSGGLVKRRPPTSDPAP